MSPPNIGGAVNVCPPNVIGIILFDGGCMIKPCKCNLFFEECAWFGAEGN